MADIRRDVLLLKAWGVFLPGVTVLNIIHDTWCPSGSTNAYVDCICQPNYWMERVPTEEEIGRKPSTGDAET